MTQESLTAISPNTVLQVQGLAAGYQGRKVVSEISFHVDSYQILALIGPNGAGKSTVLKAICGLIHVYEGSITYLDTAVRGRRPEVNTREGLVYAPQGRTVFQELSVEENLDIAGYMFSKRELEQRKAQALELFPELLGRRRSVAQTLSGGQKQMLSLARAFLLNPKCLMLDEPSLGLSPSLVKDVLTKIVDICHTTESACVVVEQKVKDVLQVSDYVCGMKLGQVQFFATVADTGEGALKELFL